MNKETLLAKPDTRLMSEFLGDIEAGNRPGEDEVSRSVTPAREPITDDLSLGLESNVWLQAQLLQLRSQNASLRSELEDSRKIGREREDSNPGRSDQLAVLKPRTTDRRCLPYTPSGNVEANPRNVEANPGNEDEHPDGLVTRLPDQSVSSRPVQNSGSIRSPRYHPDRPEEQEISSALALLEMAGARQRGTRQDGLREGGPVHYHPITI